MALIPSPRALTLKEFEERLKTLKEKRLPITMENIDPAFYAWMEEQDNFLKFGLKACILLGIASLLFMLISIII